ncbi:hypothetical protein Tco_0176759, partial [Tanacetum coccineum]
NHHDITKELVKLEGLFKMSWKSWSKFFPVKSGYNPEKLEEDSLGSWRKRHPPYWK